MGLWARNNIDIRLIIKFIIYKKHSIMGLLEYIKQLLREFLLRIHRCFSFSYKVMISGFGVGLSWGGCILYY